MLTPALQKRITRSIGPVKNWLKTIVRIERAILTCVKAMTPMAGQ